MATRTRFAVSNLAPIVILAAPSAVAYAQTYPVKPVRMINPFSPGGSPDLVSCALEIAAQISAHPPLASRLTKESLNQGINMPHLTDSALMDLYRFATLETTEDKKESHAAWRQRRKAKIKDK